MSIEELYKEKFDSSVKQMKKRTGCQEDAEDIVQNAFERCVRYEKGIGNMDACFPHILRNCFIDWQREKRSNGMTMTRSLDERDEDVADVFFDGDIDILLSEVKKKKGVYGQILDLYFRSGYTQTEIAAITNVTDRTVRNYLIKFKQEVTIKEH